MTRLEIIHLVDVSLRELEFQLSKGPKSSLKIKTASAIFWNNLGILRDYGLKNIFFRNKSFLFLKLEGWNFQHLFERKFCETSQNFNSFSAFRQLLFSFLLSAVWLCSNFLRFQLSILKNKKVLFLKKILSCCQNQNKQARKGFLASKCDEGNWILSKS